MTETRRASTCPSCGAAAKADATFCGQCYADFRPPPPAPVVQAPVSAPIAPAQRAAYGVPALDPLTAPLLDVAFPASVPASAAAAVPAAPAAGASVGWPCTRCQTVNAIESMSCSLCGGGFLSTVSESSKVSLVLPVVGDITRYSRGQRAIIALGALALLLIPLALITLLLTGSPDKTTGKQSDTGSTGAGTSTTNVTPGVPDPGSGAANPTIPGNLTSTQ